MRVAEDDGVHAREAPPQPPEPAVRRPAVMGHEDPHALHVDDPHARQPHAHLRLVDVAVHGVHGRAEALEQREHLLGHEVAGVDDGVRGAQAGETRVGDPPVPPRHMRVRNDRELHGEAGAARGASSMDRDERP